MAFTKNLFEFENIEQFMQDERGILLDYCSHVSVFDFFALRYELLLQNEYRCVYDCHLYELFENIHEEAKLCLTIQFDYIKQAIKVEPSFGQFATKPNFSLGDGLGFIEDSLETDFMIDFDLDDDGGDSDLFVDDVL